MQSRSRSRFLLRDIYLGRHIDIRMRQPSRRHTATPHHTLARTRRGLERVLCIYFFSPPSFHLSREPFSTRDKSTEAIYFFSSAAPAFSRERDSFFSSHVLSLFSSDGEKEACLERFLYLLYIFSLCMLSVCFVCHEKLQVHIFLFCRHFHIIMRRFHEGMAFTKKEWASPSLFVTYLENACFFSLLQLYLYE